MQVHRRGEVLGLSSACHGVGWLRLLLGGDFLPALVALLLVIHHLEDAAVVLLDEALVMKVVELLMEGLSMLDGFVHLLDLLLQLLHLLHLLDESVLLNLLSSLGLSNLNFAATALYEGK